MDLLEILKPTSSTVESVITRSGAASITPKLLSHVRQIRGLSGELGARGHHRFVRAYVAGNDAGRAYNTFPKMGDEWIPEGMWTCSRRGATWSRTPPPCNSTSHTRLVDPVQHHSHVCDCQARGRHCVEANSSPLLSADASLAAGMAAVQVAPHLHLLCPHSSRSHAPVRQLVLPPSPLPPCTLKFAVISVPLPWRHPIPELQLAASVAGVLRLIRR